MNIYDIARLTKETNPKFFSEENLRFFGQAMISFKLNKQPNGRTLITAPMVDSHGNVMGETKRYFNPKNNELEFE